MGHQRSGAAKRVQARPDQGRPAYPAYRRTAYGLPLTVNVCVALHGPSPAALRDRTPKRYMPPPRLGVAPPTEQLAPVQTADASNHALWIVAPAEFSTLSKKDVAEVSRIHW